MKDFGVDLVIQSIWQVFIERYYVPRTVNRGRDRTENKVYKKPCPAAAHICGMLISTANRPWLLWFWLSCLFLCSLLSPHWHRGSLDLGHHGRSFPKHLSKPMRNHIPGWSPSSSPLFAAHVLLPDFPSSSLIPALSLGSSLVFLSRCDWTLMIWFNHEAQRSPGHFFLGRQNASHSNDMLKSSHHATTHIYYIFFFMIVVT